MIFQMPSWSMLKNFNAASPQHLRVLGAMGAYLPTGFEASLSKAITSANNGTATTDLANIASAAMLAAGRDVQSAMKARTKDISQAVLADEMTAKEVSAEYDSLKVFGLYGGAANAEMAQIRKMAISRNIKEIAKGLSSDKESSFVLVVGDGGVQERKLPKEWVQLKPAPTSKETASNQKSRTGMDSRDKYEMSIAEMTKLTDAIQDGLNSYMYEIHDEDEQNLFRMAGGEFHARGKLVVVSVGIFPKKVFVYLAEDGIYPRVLLEEKNFLTTKSRQRYVESLPVNEDVVVYFTVSPPKGSRHTAIDGWSAERVQKP
jgi:hypothetical protein